MSERVEEAPPRRGLGAWLLSLSVFLLLAAAAPFFLAVLLKSYLIVDRFPPLFGLFVIVATWRFAVLVVLLTAAGVLSAFLRRRAARAGGVLRGLSLRRVQVAFLLVACGGLLLLPSLDDTRRPNRFGFYPTTPGPNEWHSDNPALPDFRVEPNEHGFRDRAWVLDDEPRRPRVLMLGDSFVYGYWIPKEEDVLSRALESALAERGAEWRVFNAAAPPSALEYCVEAGLRIGAVLQPEVIFLSYLQFDLVPFDVASTRRDLSPWLVSRLSRFGVLQDVLEAGALYAKLKLASRLDVARQRARFAELVAFAERTSALLVVWEYQPPDSVFDPWRDTVGIVFGGCREALCALGECGLDAYACEGRWRGDPSLAYENDSHPTPRANHLVAGLLADLILEHHPAPAPHGAP